MDENIGGELGVGDKSPDAGLHDMDSLRHAESEEHLVKQDSLNSHESIGDREED